MQLIYDLSIGFYRLLILLVSPFNKKASLWISGRKDFFRKWEGFNAGGRKVAWIHCASLGEFEQGRPVIEELKRRDGNLFILLTFFSPSGYEIRKDYPGADAVCYLPADTAANARRFIGIFKPSFALFIKYEFWYHYISTLNNSGIPAYLASANFRPGQLFFRWYGIWFGKMLKMFSHIFVQSESSRTLLTSAGVDSVTVAGDTRFDRVAVLPESAKKVHVAEKFSDGVFTVVAGSTWPPDNNLWVRYMNETRHNIRLIIAPHEIDRMEIDKLAGRFKDGAVKFSEAGKPDNKPARVLIIDNIGMLSSLYRYGRLAYIGGGYGSGIHNILEACTYGVPVVFGPNYHKFREARELKELGGAFPVGSYSEFAEMTDRLIDDGDLLRRAGSTAAKYVSDGTGATVLITKTILDS